MSWQKTSLPWRSLPSGCLFSILKFKQTAFETIFWVSLKETGRISAHPLVASTMLFIDATTTHESIHFSYLLRAFFTFFIAYSVVAAVIEISDILKLLSVRL
jgi:hypothetical protein